MNSWTKKPKATTVPTPIYNDTAKLMAGIQGNLSQGYTQGIADRNKTYSGAGDVANNLLTYAKKQQGLGGNIDPEVQARVVRDALGGSSQAGIMPGTAGSRSLVARDLGLTSMDLEKQRQAEAGGILGMSEFRPPQYGDQLSDAFLKSEMGNTEMGNQWIYNQLAANESVKGKDSFLGGLAKGLATTVSYGALDNASSSM